MNTALVTTGVIPLVVGSVETFQLQGFLDALPWNLAGGTVSLRLADPLGNVTTIPAAISGGCALATWTVVSPAGRWVRDWVITDASLVHQVSQAIIFDVVDFP